MGIWEDLSSGKNIEKALGSRWTSSSSRAQKIDHKTHLQRKISELTEEGESALKILVGRSDHTLVFTDRKVIYISGTTMYHLLYPYGAVKYVRWTDKGYGTSVFMLSSSMGSKELYGIPKEDAQEAVSVVNQCQGAGSDSLDFSYIKCKLNTVFNQYTLACPKCQGDLVFPAEGCKLKCSCGKELTAYEINSLLKKAFN